MFSHVVTSESLCTTDKIWRAPHLLKEWRISRWDVGWEKRRLTDKVKCFIPWGSDVVLLFLFPATSVSIWLLVSLFFDYTDDLIPQCAVKSGLPEFCQTGRISVKRTHPLDLVVVKKKEKQTSQLKHPDLAENCTAGKGHSCKLKFFFLCFEKGNNIFWLWTSDDASNLVCSYQLFLLNNWST